MDNILENDGVLQVVLEDYVEHKLPRILLIEEQVEKGARLSDEELIFLKHLHHEIHQFESFINDHPTFKTIYVGFVSLCCSIMNLATQNEQANT